jgi:hypothetical protein
MRASLASTAAQFRRGVSRPRGRYRAVGDEFLNPDTVPKTTYDAYYNQERLFTTRYALIFLFIAFVVVVTLFLVLHATVCGGFALHSPPFPEPFNVDVIVESPVAQELGLLVSRFQAAFATVPSTATPATQLGSLHATAYKSVIAQAFATHGDFYAAPTVHSLSVHVREACSVALTLNGAGGVTATDAAWFRPVKSTCRAVTGATPTLVDVTTDGNITLSTLTGDVVLLFETLPFTPLAGNAFVAATTQPLVVQVDARMRPLFTGPPVTVTSTTTIPAPLDVDTLVYRPAAYSGAASDALTYVTVDVDAGYAASDNWGAMALQLQLVQTLASSGLPRDRTAFVVGTAGSGLELVRQGILTNVKDVVVLTACGLANGRDALYTTRYAFDTKPLLQPIVTTIVFQQTGYVSGAAALANHAAWQVTSWSPALKTVAEVTVAGGVSGLQTTPSVAVAPSPQEILVPCLIAQLTTLVWMSEVGALSPVGISGLFV